MRLALLAPLLVVAQNGPPPQDQTPTYVSGTPCRTCHPDVWRNFYKNPHYINVASEKEPPEKTGCESCHGPGSLHVASHGATPIPHAFSKMAPEDVLAD